MAEDVVEHSIAAPRAEPDSIVEPIRPREHPRVYRWRFGIAYFVLAVLAGVGVGIAVMIVERPDEAAAPAWSEWQPVGRETSYPDQIAEYVGQGYRLQSGSPLAAVIASPPQVNTDANVAVQAVVIQNQSALPSADPDVEIIPPRTRSCTRSAAWASSARSRKVSRAPSACSCCGARRSSSRCTRSSTWTTSTR